MNIIPLKRNKPAQPEFEVGDVVGLAEFFWIVTGKGFAKDACHGHYDPNNPRDPYIDKIDHPGSADEHCKVLVLDQNDKQDMYRVCLLRPSMPFGALAPHGTVFDMTADDLRFHADNTERVHAELRRKRAFAKQVAKFKIGFQPTRK